VNPLTTSGNRIVDAVTGQPVTLRGVNWSGLEYAIRPIPPADFDTIRHWNANVVRLPFNQEWALTDDAYLATLDAAVEAFADRNIYTILDLQWFDARYARGWHADGSTNYVPALPNEPSVEIWSRLAARYQANPNVIFDIFNEPHDPLPGDDPALPRRVTPSRWLPWARRLVGTIRRFSTGLILVPGVDWAYDLSAYPVDGLDNVVYSTHVYPNKGRNWDYTFGNLAAIAPVFAGEWGGGDDDLQWGRRLAAYFDEHNIGWTAWSWNDRPHLMREGRPTPFGELVRSLLLQPRRGSA
jgi:hypothetical protein